MRAALILCIVVQCGVVSAQSGLNYRVEESTMNAGGHPREGLSPVSASYRISLDAIGEAPFAPLLQSTGYSMHAGFGLSYPPPREVRQLLALGDKTTFFWVPERSVGRYHVYRGELNLLPFSDGTCPVVEVPAHYAVLNDYPEIGNPLFFLVSAENRLHEEGTAGYDSAGVSRVHSAPCP